MYHDGAWEIGTLSGAQLLIGGQKVVGARAAAIGDPAAGGNVDAEARAAVGLILAAMRGHGLIEL